MVTDPILLWQPDHLDPLFYIYFFKLHNTTYEAIPLKHLLRLNRPLFLV